MKGKRDIPLCAVFRTASGKRYLYVSRTNRILRLKGRLERCPAAEVLSSVGADLLPRGPFPAIVDRAEAQHLAADALDGRCDNLIIEITRQCNLRCAYCVYSGNYAGMRTHAAKTISWEDVKAALDRFAVDSRKRETREISFYGGETLLEFELMQRSIAYARQLFAGRRVTFGASTNGVLLTPERILWLKANPDVSVMVTVNGPYHDRWRHRADGGGSLDAIMANLAWARTNARDVWERQIDFICNISSLDQVRPMRDFYREKVGKCPKLVTAIDRSRANEGVREMLGPDHEALRDGLFAEYLASGDDFLHVLFGLPLSDVHDRRLCAPDEPGVSRTCTPFLNRLFVSADGRLDFCERVGELAFGTARNGEDRERVADVQRKFLALLNGHCRRCWAQRLCPLCFKDVDGLTGPAPTIPAEFCRDVKRKTLAALREYCEVASGHPAICRRLEEMRERARRHFLTERN